MNFTVADVLGVGAGFVLFGLFAFAPGYVAGWLTDVFEFRRRRLATRVAAAVPLSIGLMPVTAYLLWHLWLPLVWAVFGTCGVACAVLLARDWRAKGLRLSRAGWKVAALAAGWVVVGTLSLIDLQFGKQLYFPFSDSDHLTRVAFTAAIARDGIPPHNPFFFAGQPGLLRYHYFWFIPAALAERLGGWLVTPRMAVIDGVLWSGLGLLGMIALYLRFFQAKGGEQIERRTLIGTALLMVTGLDIVPVLMIDHSAHIVLPSIEWWNNPIASWINTVLWVPQDLAGLTAGLTGFLLAWEAARAKGRRHRLAALAASGVAFGSSVGLSIYLGGTIAVCCVLWFAIALVKRWWRHAGMVLSAGVIGSVLIAPWVWQILHGPHAGNQGGAKGIPFVLGMRAFTFADILVRPHGATKLLLLNTALLPVNYAVEFGFFFLVGFLWLRRRWRQGWGGETEWGAMALGAGSLLICTFLSSTVIHHNDLAMRSPLVVQFVLLLWAAEMWNEGTIGFGLPALSKARPEGPKKALPLLITVSLVLGVMGSGYELFAQRAFPILSDRYAFPLEHFAWLSPDQQLGRRTYALRSAYAELNRMLPASDVVQADPRGGIGNAAAELYSGRPMVADSGECGTVFGGSAQYCEHVILPRLKPLFDDRRPVSMGEVERTCRKFGITALLFQDTDPVWKDNSSWIWQVQPMISNDYARVIACDGPMRARRSRPGGQP